MLGIAAWTTAAAPSSATLNVYDNTALAGSPWSTSTVYGLGALSFPLRSDGVGSAEVLATLLTTNNTHYSFDCDFGAARVGFLHVDGHLVCQSGAYSNRSTTTHQDTPLPVLSKQRLPLRMSLIYDGSASAGDSGGGSGENVSVSVVVTGVSDTRHKSATGSVPMVPGLPSAEATHDAFNRGLLQGWGLWHSNTVLDAVLLPEGAVVRAALCNAAGDCLEEALMDWQNGTADTHAPLRLGLHAYDRSYAQLFAAHNGCNVSFTFGGGVSSSAELVLLAEPVNSGGGDGGSTDACEGFTLILAGDRAWFRANSITASASAGTITFASAGLRNTTLTAVGKPAAAGASLSPTLAAMPHLGFALAGGSAVGASTAIPKPTLKTLRAMLSAARNAELARLAAKFGAEHAAVAAAVQAAVLWNCVFVPTEAGPITPVIRGNPWHLNGNAVAREWEYILFDWVICRSRASWSAFHACC